MSSRSLSLAAELVADRRRFLLSGASLAVLPWLGTVAQGAVKRRVRFDGDPFTLGVASGEPAPDGMVLWTRLRPSQPTGAACRPKSSKWAGRSLATRR